MPHDGRSTDRPTATEVQELRKQVEQQAREIEAKEQQIERIAEIQESLLPERTPRIDGMNLAASHVAPGGAGGDYFDFLALEFSADHSPKSDGRWLVVVADATGHGPASAVIMAMLHSILHAYPGPHDDPGEVLAFMNRQMCQNDRTGLYATAVLGVLDPLARSFGYAVAGHHAPLLSTPGRGVAKLAVGDGPPLGVDPDAVFASHLCRLAPAETLVIYTDGAIEAQDEAGRQFGLERLLATLRAASGTPREILASVNRAVAAHRRLHELVDDKTLVAIQVAQE